MSDFYSRCLSCGIDLPCGSTFCTALCRDRWHAKHEGDAKAVTCTDVVGGMDVRERSGDGRAFIGNGGLDRPRVAEQSASHPTTPLTPPATLSRNHDADCRCKLCDVDWIL